MTGHEIGLLKGYMLDLVEQARQESMTYRAAGYQERAYSPDQALMDLLAILDDRMESEGVQVGISESFRNRMGEICRRSLGHVQESSWMAANMAANPLTRADVRSVAYQALLEYIEAQEEGD